MLRLLVRQLRSNASAILAIAGVAFVVSTILLTAAAPVAVDSRIIFGLSRSLGLLVTVDSPNGFDLLGPWRYPARSVAWIVCVSGWLLIPLIISELLGVEDKWSEIEASLRNAYGEVEKNPRLREELVAGALKIVQEMSESKNSEGE